MDITPIYPRVIGLDVHQAKINACAIAEQADGAVTVKHRDVGAFKRDRRALAEWAKAFGPTTYSPGRTACRGRVTTKPGG